MKIKPEHYNFLKTSMGPFKDKIQSHYDFILQEGKAKDPEMRLRWDLLYAAIPSSVICDMLYPYLNDTHIDTALKNIIQEFRKEIQNHE